MTRSTSRTIPLDDPEVFRLFQEGRTKGVFQFESGGMVDLLRKARPTQFEDLAALNALYRPGALDAGMVDEYVAPQERRVEGEVPRAGDEGAPRGDVRRHRLPGAGHADRAGGRRLLARPGRSAAQGDGQEGRGDHGRGARQVRHGAVANGYDKKKANEIFDYIEPFAALRLQQVALGGLRARRLPDGVAEGSLPAALHGRADDARRWTGPTAW